MSSRVLYVIHYPTFGGPHNQALRLYEDLAQSGWEMTVLIPDSPGNAAARLRSGGVPVLTTHLHRLRATYSPKTQAAYLTGFRDDIRRIHRAALESNSDLILIGGLANPQAAFAARRAGLPTVWQVIDTSTPRFLVRALMPIVKRYADALMVTGRAVSEHHRGSSSFGKRLFHYVPPVDATEFSPDPSVRGSSRLELRIRPDEFVIGTISNVNPDKDLMTFVEAAARVRASHPAAKFVVLGEQYPQHEKHLNDLQKRARELGLSIDRDLIFHQPGERVARLAQSFDVFWLTSRSEGLPTCIGEAMALGIPVIATDVGSVSEAVESGLNGFVVHPSAPDEIASATRQIIDQTGLRQRLSSGARATALTLYSPQRCAEVHLNAFNSAMETSKHQR